MLILNGCFDRSVEELTEIYSKENAIAKAEETLQIYAGQEGLKREDFKGPYLYESLGLDYPTYTVCYIHPQHYFCFHHYGNLSQGYLKKNASPKNATSEWLKAIENGTTDDYITP